LLEDENGIFGYVFGLRPEENFFREIFSRRPVFGNTGCFADLVCLDNIFCPNKTYVIAGELLNVRSIHQLASSTRICPRTSDNVSMRHFTTPLNKRILAGVFSLDSTLQFTRWDRRWWNALAPCLRILI